MEKDKKTRTLFYIIIFLIVAAGLLLRILIFDKPGGDYQTYKDAMNMLHQGKNPYVWTVESFNLDSGEHGYAYFPTLLYIQYSVWLLNNLSGVMISTVILWKIPVLLAELSLLYLILRKCGGAKSGRGSLVFCVTAAAFWVFNPYFMARYDYSLYDPLFLLALFLALEKAEKNSAASGFFYALSVSLKTAPVILLPLFLVKTPGKLKFIASASLLFILISIPFLRSPEDFNAYLQGSFFVHSQRELQGRPFFSWVTYGLQDYGVNFYQYKFMKVYSVLAMVGAFALPAVLYFRKKLKSKYSWVLLSFFIYLLFTPVLSRTHILWIFPWLIIFLYEKFCRNGKMYIASFLLLLVWLLSFFYLLSWNKGFEVEQGGVDGRIVTGTEKEEWELSRITRQKYYELRGKFGP